MPDYVVTGPDGRQLRFTGPAPPSQPIIDQAFRQVPQTPDLDVAIAKLQAQYPTQMQHASVQWAGPISGALMKMREGSAGGTVAAITNPSGAIYVRPGLEGASTTQQDLEDTIAHELQHVEEWRNRVSPNPVMAWGKALLTGATAEPEEAPGVGAGYEEERRRQATRRDIMLPRER